MKRLFFLLLLAGCATPQERAQRVVARHAPVCEALGFQRGSDQWRQCVLTRISQEQADDAALLQLYGATRQRSCFVSGNQVICD